MENQDHIVQMIQLMDRPAFCVLDGTIVAANQAGLAHMVPVNQPVAPLILSGQADYAAFAGTQIALCLQINGTCFDATVSAVGPYHIFMLEPRGAEPELKALALAAQQLRTPLNNVMLGTGLLFPTLEIPEDSPAADYLARINRALNVMQRIVSNMSDAARFSEEPPRMAVQDVDAVLREIFEQAGVLCEFAGVQLEFIGLNRPVYSLIDSEKLERCVYNIVSNALKAMPNGGSISANLTRRGNTLYLTVRDTGCGIPHGNAFDRHLRQPALEDPRQGLGLGMKMIRACAEAHGGTVILDSSEGQGTTLTVSLAIRLDDIGVRSPSVDYAGERNHGLMELAESLPHTLYKPVKKH